MKHEDGCSSTLVDTTEDENLIAVFSLGGGADDSDAEEMALAAAGKLRPG